MNSFFHQNALTGFAAPQYHNKKSGNGFLKMSADVSDSKPVVVTKDVIDPKYEIDFSTLSCSKLQELLYDLAEFLQTVRLTPSGVAYYTGKQEQIKLAYVTKCGKPAGAGSGVITPVLIPIVPALNTSNGATPYAGSGGGGGAAGADTKKKKCDIWCLIAIVATAFTAYQTYKYKAA